MTRPVVMSRLNKTTVQPDSDQLGPSDFPPTPEAMMRRIEPSRVCRVNRRRGAQKMRTGRDGSGLDAHEEAQWPLVCVTHLERDRVATSQGQCGREGELKGPPVSRDNRASLQPCHDAYGARIPAVTCAQAQRIDLDRPALAGPVDALTPWGQSGSAPCVTVPPLACGQAGLTR
jgi:hypothetical protein